MGKIVYHLINNNLYILNSNILCWNINYLKNSVGGDLPIIENNGNHLYLLTLVIIRDYIMIIINRNYYFNNGNLIKKDI